MPHPRCARAGLGLLPVFPLTSKNSWLSMLSFVRGARWEIGDRRDVHFVWTGDWGRRLGTGGQTGRSRSFGRCHLNAPSEKYQKTSRLPPLFPNNRDFDSCESSVIQVLSKPACPVTKLPALLKKHSFPAVMTLVHRTHPCADRFLGIKQTAKQV